MDENKNPIKNRLSEQLPSHAPDPGSWQRLSAKLDALDADAALQEKLRTLPVHSPDPATWNGILFRLNRTAYIKTGVRVALSAAAGLLLFITVSRLSDNYLKTPLVPEITEQIQPGIPSSAEGNSEPGKANIAESNQANVSSEITSSEQNLITDNTVIQKVSPIISQFDYSIQGNEIYLNMDMPIPDENATELFAGITFIDVESIAGSGNGNSTGTSVSSILLKKQNDSPVTPPVRYYTPKEPVSGYQKNNFALTMNYLPENIYNGTDNSLFHNVDVTASYNKEKVRFNTSLGMAYNEEQFVFELNYNINIPVTATGPGGHVDTVGYAVGALASEYQGTEKHQYFTYNLGIGRKLFRVGKFSSWINAGAGFGVKLNDPDIIASTEKKIQTQYNARITSVNANQPIYNDVNINFVTGIDFSYKLFNRLSLSFTPTSRWYFKPLLTVSGQATDELTLGFKTGMKFDF